jgi:flagellar motor component MotA
MGRDERDLEQGIATYTGTLGILMAYALLNPSGAGLAKVKVYENDLFNISTA